MRKFIVDQKYNHKKLSNCILDYFENLSKNNFFKALRKKDIRINDRKVSDNEEVHTGDVISIYLNDKILLGESIEFQTIFEDQNIVIVNKPAGIEVTDPDQNKITLTTILEETLKIKLYPCHRLDRNTTGLILYAKHLQALEILLEKFKGREIHKSYYCVCIGIPEKKSENLQAFLFKDRKKSHVLISEKAKSGYLPIETSYQILQKNEKKNLALLEVTIPTGRTHQIRAHLAYIAHPVLGDGKYGINMKNKFFHVDKQYLHSRLLKFEFKTDAGILNYLNHQSFSTKIPEQFLEILSET